MGSEEGGGRAPRRSAGRRAPRSRGLALAVRRRPRPPPRARSGSGRPKLRPPIARIGARWCPRSRAPAPPPTRTPLNSTFPPGYPGSERFFLHYADLIDFGSLCTLLRWVSGGGGGGGGSGRAAARAGAMAARPGAPVPARAQIAPASVAWPRFPCWRRAAGVGRARSVQTAAPASTPPPSPATRAPTKSTTWAPSRTSRSRSSCLSTRRSRRAWCVERREGGCRPARARACPGDTTLPHP